MSKAETSASKPQILPVASIPQQKGSAPFMVEQGWARIVLVIIGAMHVLVASPSESAYNADKHGIAGDKGVLPYCPG